MDPRIVVIVGAFLAACGCCCAGEPVVLPPVAFTSGAGATLGVLPVFVPDLIVSPELSAAPLPVATWDRDKLANFFAVCGYRVVNGIVVKAPEVVAVADSYGITKDSLPTAHGAAVARVEDHFLVSGPAESVGAWVTGVQGLQEVRARRIRVQIMISDEETGRQIGTAFAAKASLGLLVGGGGAGLLGLAKSFAASATATAAPSATDTAYAAVVDGVYTVLSGRPLAVAVQETRRVDTTISSNQGATFQGQKQDVSAGYKLDIEMEAGPAGKPWVGTLNLVDSRFVDTTLSTTETTYSSGLLLGSGADGAVLVQFGRTVDQSSTASVPLPILRWLKSRQLSTATVMVSVLIADADVK